MRLLLVTPYFPPDNGPSAPPLSILVENLAKLGNQVTVLAAVPHFPTGIVPNEYRRGLWQKDERDGFQVYRMRVPSGDRSNLRHRLFTFIVYQILTTFVGMFIHYDAIIITNPALETGLPFTVLAWLRRKPVMFCVWDLYPEVGENLGVFKNPIALGFVKAIEDFCLQHSTIVQALTEGFVPNLIERISSKTRLLVIPLWIDTDFIRPQRGENSFREEYGLDNHFIVLYAGNLGLSQGLETVLYAAQQLTNDVSIRFVFVGDGSGRLELVAKAHQMKLENVVFIPYQPRERLPEVLASADISLVVLRKEIGTSSLPSKTFSILASGRPVLASVDEDSDVCKLVQSAGAGLQVPPETPDALVYAIQKLKANIRLRNLYGKNGRAYVCSHHSAQAAAKQFGQLLMDIVGEQAR